MARDTKTYYLTLKNMYRLLMTVDYPVYSLPVIPKNQRRGMTLMRFWCELLPPGWKEHHYGRMIWRQTGSKNRFSSEFCNRRDVFPYYKSYYEELTGMPEGTCLESLTQHFADFLSDHRYDPEVLEVRLGAFLHGAVNMDPLFREVAGDSIVRHIEEIRQCISTQVMTHAAILSFLTFYAAVGEGGDPETILAESRRVLKRLSDMQSGRDSEMKILTDARDWMHQEIHGYRIYGRETELFELEEMCSCGRKVYIKGPGGIGKTELLRALIRRIREEGKISCIAAVTFRESLAHSLVSAFRGLKGKSFDEKYRECLFLLSESSGNTVLFIDDIQPGLLNDEDKKMLCGLPSSVFTTGRHGELPGFDSFTLRPVQPSSAALIFRQAAGQHLSDGEKLRLEELIRDKSMDFPLVLKFFGNLARQRGYSVSELEGWIRKAFPESRRREQSSADLFRDIYLSSGLSGEEEKFIRLLAALPAGGYSRSILASLIGEEKEGDAIIRSLEDAGWLTVSEENVSLHPLLAESVRTEPVTEKDLDILFDRTEAVLTDELFKDVFRDIFAQAPKEDSQEAQRAFPDLMLPELTVSAGLRLTDSLSKRAVKILLYSVFCLIRCGMAGADAYARIVKQAEKFRESDDEIRDLMLLIELDLNLRRMGQEDIDIVRTAIEAGKERAILHHIMWVELIGLLIQTGDLKQAEQLLSLSETWQEKGVLPESLKVGILFLTAELHMCQGVYDQSEEEFAKCAEIAGAGTEAYYIALFRSALINIFMENLERAEAQLERVDPELPENSSWACRRDYYNVCTWLARARGDLERALSSHAETLVLCEKYLGVESMDYMNAKSIQGTMLAQAGRFAEAFAAHEEAVRLCRKSGVSGHAREILWNNAAVAYLDGGEPEKAAVLLEEAAEITKVTGGLPAAENAWNRSRVMRSRGDREGEIACLNECIPVFEREYGETHSKTMRAKERL